MDQQRSGRANRLANETSPYLLQHAHNPVDWFPWGPEALAASKAADRPILLSIGYAACHWCHVMERESFENLDIAELMNRHFVCVKVDREERPDLDDIYMAATVALSGSGGWPMTVFLTPDQRPFFAGTYFPPEDRYGRPGFKQLLGQIADAWKHDRDSLIDQADALTRHVREQSRASEPLSIGRDAMNNACEVLWRSFDRKYGGFGAAPKFPPSATLSLLLRHYRQSGDLRALEMVVGTLNGMKNGGMYDHVAGGFARYSTDERWLVPHFEKMLYDNAQLAHVYLEALQVTGRAEYGRVASETLDYIAREMQGPDGGYFSATDADSEGEEGKYFVWSPDQVDEVLERPDAERFCAFYDVTFAGNWEGKSVLNTPRPLAEVAAELGIEAAELSQSLERSKPLMYEARLRRVPPLLDDKVLTAHNGLMIGAMAFGHQVLGDPAYLKSATRAADYLWSTLRREDGGLFRTARGGAAHLPAYLEDYAYLADGLLTLYEAGGEPRMLERALALGERLLSDFGEERAGAFYSTAHNHEALIARTREGHDGALPSANSVAARALLRLGRHFGRPYLVERALDALMAYGRQIARLPRAFTSALSVVDMALSPALELVTVGTRDDPRTRDLLTTIGSLYLPNKVQAHVDPAVPSSASVSPLTEGKLGAAIPQAYVCENFTCQAPVSDPARLKVELEAAEERCRKARRAEIGRRPLAGSATRAGTRRLASERRGPVEAGLSSSDYRELADTGLWVSRVGFGSYRLTAGSAHGDALRHALLSGFNLIDTAGSYVDGDSERVIGQTLASLVADKHIRREQVVVVTKLGTLQGGSLGEHQLREQQGRPLEGVVKASDELWYCLHPSFLEQELERSLGRLGLATVDVCLLHNPEYLLQAKGADGATLDERRAELYRRVEQAFSFLERACDAGKIACYGVSSNTLGRDQQDELTTSAASLVAAAERAGGKQHRFKVLELPLNVYEAPAAALDVIAWAGGHGVAVLTNRPLHAFLDEGLLRLADPEIASDAPPLESQLEKVAELERRFVAEFAPQIRVPEGALPATALFDWAGKLAHVAFKLVSLSQYDELEGVVAPRLEQAVASLDRAFGSSHPTFGPWRDAYAREMRGLLASVRRHAAERSKRVLDELRSALAPELGPVAHSLPLSQLAVALPSSLPGVTSVLVGMRQRAYVEDVVASLRLNLFDGSMAAFKALSARGA